MLNDNNLEAALCLVNKPQFPIEEWDMALNKTISIILKFKINPLLFNISNIYLNTQTCLLTRWDEVEASWGFWQTQIQCLKFFIRFMHLFSSKVFTHKCILTTFFFQIFLQLFFVNFQIFKGELDEWRVSWILKLE